MHGRFFKKSVDSLSCMWWEYKDESTGRYRVVSSTIAVWLSGGKNFYEGTDRRF